jgi:DNA-binding NarL/FixJ family response regulator
VGAINSSRRTSRDKILRMYQVSPPQPESIKESTTWVLLADDDPGFRSTLKRVMETRGGFRVREAGNGEEAVQMARQFRPDAILMDLAMPRINGLEATRIIKEQLPGTRIIVCSVHNESTYLRAAFAHGADAFMSKSKCFAELDTVERLVQEGQA